MCAEVRPFRPLKFMENRTASLSPPFDTISKEQEARLKSNPHNITYLTLPDEGGPEGARNKLDQWLGENVLSPEKEDSIIVVEQKFRFEGNEMKRLGIISLVRINPDDGSIKPHEKTFESAVGGRVSIMSRLQSQLEPIFLTVDCHSLEALLSGGISSLEPDIKHTDEEGTEHRVYTIKDTQHIEKIQEVLSHKTFLVADGHHRLEATRRLSKQSNGSNQDFWNYVMAYITPIKEEGLVIAGIHRLVRKDLKLDQFREEAGKYFDLRDVEGAINTGNMYIYDGEYTELVPKEKEIASAIGRDISETLVHAEILNEILFGAVMKLTDEDLEYRVSYLHDLSDAKKQVDNGEAGMVILMPKWDKDEFLRIISDGRSLPQKSTYFFPKVPSGIAINAYLGE